MEEEPPAYPPVGAVYILPLYQRHGHGDAFEDWEYQVVWVSTFYGMVRVVRLTKGGQLSKRMHESREMLVSEFWEKVNERPPF